MAKRKRKVTSKRKTTRKMSQGECRKTRKGVEYCRTREGVRFTGSMGEVGLVDDLGEFAMSPGECKNVKAGGGVRTLCYTSKGPRFVPTRSGVSIADLAAARRRRR